MTQTVTGRSSALLTLPDACRASNCGTAYTANAEAGGTLYGSLSACPERRKAWGRRHPQAAEVEVDFARLGTLVGRAVWRPAQA